MRAYPTLKRGVSIAATCAVLVGALALAGLLPRFDTPPAHGGAKKASEQDWTMFGGDGSRNMVNLNAKNVPVKWTADEENQEYQNIKWGADLGSKAYGGPIVADGRVFVGTNNQKPRDPKYTEVNKRTGKKEGVDLGVVMAFGESNGEFLWQNVYPKLAAGRVVDWPLEGICSTPLVEDDRLYYVSNRCEVICANTKSGDTQWKLDMIQELGVFPHNLSVCSPLLVKDSLWIVTANGVNEDHINVPAPLAPSFIKVDKNSGKVLWKDNSPTVKLTQVNKQGDSKDFFKRLVNQGDLIQHGQWSNPAHAVINGQDQIIFPGGDGWMRAYTLEGKLIWQFDCNPKDAEYQLAGKGTRNDFIATPVVYKNRVYIGVGQDPEHETGVGHLWCIDATKQGDISPEIVTDNSVWPPKTKKNENSGLVWHYGGPAPDPKKLGRNNYFGRTMSTCAIHDGLCYAAELAGYLHCLDAETGKVHWTHDTRAPIWSSPFWMDNKVYLGTDNGEVWIFAHGPEKKLLARNEMEGRIRATPVFANNVLYVMTENKLYAVVEGAKK